MLKRLLKAFWREPDFYVGGKANPYIRRWWVWPRNRWINLYLHHILRSDADWALHDHPWWFVSMILWGGYWEHRGHERYLWCDPISGCTKHEWTEITRKWRWLLSVAFRPTSTAHRIEMPEGKTAWTLVLTGRTVRTWGFYCRMGWVPWQDFVDQEDHGNVGRGCGET